MYEAELLLCDDSNVSIWYHVVRHTSYIPGVVWNLQDKYDLLSRACFVSEQFPFISPFYTELPVCMEWLCNIGNQVALSKSTAAYLLSLSCKDVSMWV